MVCCTRNEIDSWTVHLDGIVALVNQASFSDTLRTVNSRPHLQYHFITIIRYFLVEGVMHPHLMDWSPGRIPNAKPDQIPAVRLVDILIRFMKLHASIRVDPDPDPRIAAGSAHLFDMELEDWEMQLPKRWGFSLEKSDDFQRTFNGKYIAYNDVWAPRDLNHYFWARLMVNEMIVRHLSRIKMPTPDDVEQRRIALDTTARMATYICAGAASQMGAFGCGHPPPGLAQLPPLNGVFMLLFPLAVAGGAAGADDEVHKWVLDTLQKIGRKMGIRRALEMIPTLQRVRERKLKEFCILN